MDRYYELLYYTWYTYRQTNSKLILEMPENKKHLRLPKIPHCNIKWDTTGSHIKSCLWEQEKKGGLSELDFLLAVFILATRMVPSGLS